MAEGQATDIGPNAWLVDEMYEQYLADPASVNESWQDFFADYRPGGGQAPLPAPGSASTAPAPAPTAPAAPPAAAPLPAGAGADVVPGVGGAM